MTSPLPPRRRDSRNLADVLRHERTRGNQLDRGLAFGKSPNLRPLKSQHSDGDDFEDDSDDLAILFSNTDVAKCTANGATISIPLSHVPEDGSEQVYYGRTPLRRSEWTRTDSVLTIPGEPWFRAGRYAWVDYAYYDDGGGGESDPASFVAVTTITGDHTSIDIPGTPTPGDMLVLVLFGRDAAACSDTRFTFKAGTAAWGIWVGTDDGTTATVPITLSSPSGGGMDGAGALARITGSPLLPATSEQTSTLSGATTFAPTMPSGGSFGVMALVSGTGLVSGTLSDDELGNWTTRAKQAGGGSGFCKVYIGTSSTGPTAGQWSNTGSSPGWGAWVGGLQ